MAEAFGFRYSPHVWGTGIAIAASLHLLAVLPPHTRSSPISVAPLLEFDRTENRLRQAIFTEPIEHTRGIVPVPNGSDWASRSIGRRWSNLLGGDASAAARDRSIAGWQAVRSSLAILATHVMFRVDGERCFCRACSRSWSFPVLDQH